MDSHDIDYSKKDFWENILTGESKQWAEDTSVLTIHENLKQQDKGFFEFEKNWDFADSNKWFLEKLNSIDKKQATDEESNSEWESTETEDSE